MWVDSTHSLDRQVWDLLLFESKLRFLKLELVAIFRVGVGSMGIHGF
ncbi:MAG: hypothetical protein IPH57_18875 [Saprospiraceae bacterium]|nr:hypothetical protein [Saprospiraceae bacterium]